MSRRNRGGSAHSGGAGAVRAPPAPEVADVYASIVADDILTVAEFGNELLRGPRSDRTGR